MQPSPFPPGSLVVAYLRDSGGEKQELSVSQQERSVRTWCDENGLILTHVYIDAARSAKSTRGRKEFLELINYFHNPGKPEAGIVLWSFSRFARNLNNASMYKGIIRSAGYEIVSLNDDVPSGPIGPLVEMIKDWANEDRNNQSSMEIIRSQTMIWNEHGAIGGTPPKGFMHGERIQISDPRDHTPRMVSRWVPNPDEWEACKLAWELRAAGVPVKMINNRFHLYKSISSFTDMFKRRIYLGEMTYHGITKVDYAPPMIDLATWDAVQAINRSKKNMAHLKDPKLHPRRNNSSYMLTGLIYCHRCGSALNGHVIMRKKNGPDWKYYRCTFKNNSDRCDSRLIPLEAIESAVLASICKYIYTPEAMKAMQDVETTGVMDSTAALKKEKKHLVAELAGVRNRITNITSAIAESGHSRALLNNLSEAEIEEANLVAQISEVEKEISSAHIFPSDETLDDWIKSALKIIDSGDPHSINMLLRGFINKILAVYDNKVIKVEIQYKYPSAPLVESPPDGTNRPKA